MAKTDEFGEPVELEAAGRLVEITNPNKVMFPSVGPGKQERTKLDLANYYLSVGDALMRTVADRPVLLERYPNGVREKSFFQKRIPDSAPDWLVTTTVETINGTPSRALVIADLAHVLWAVNMGVLGLHVWPFRASDPDDADEMRIDLDPSPGVTFDQVREAAGHVRDLLAEHGMLGFAKTTGSKGIHVYVRVEPGWDSFAIRGAVITLGRELASRHPGPHHRQVVEGGTRRTGVHRLQPERAAQEHVRCVGRPAHESARRCRRRSVGTNSTRSTPRR